MANDPILGKPMSPPPSDGKSLASKQFIMNTVTQPVFSVSGLNYSGAAVQSTGGILRHIGNDGFIWAGGSWQAERACSLVMQIDIDAPVSGATITLYYFIDAAETSEITAAAISVTNGSGADQKLGGTDWGIDTDQPDWVEIVSPPFDLFRGTNTIRLIVDIASGNTFNLMDLNVNPPPFTQQNMTINFFWQQICNETVLPGGHYTMTDTYTTGVSKVSSTTSEIASSLGISATAGYGGISASINSSTSAKQTTAQQISLTQTHEHKNEQYYPNTTDQMMQLQLWQACMEYLIGNCRIVDQLQGDLNATMQYSPANGKAAPVKKIEEGNKA